MNQIKMLKDFIENSKSIVFFGGAGVSTESNIPDFRGAQGLFTKGYKTPPEEIVSLSFFNQHVDEFYKFYRDKMIYQDALPNDAHHALFRLESQGKLKTIITQNVDGLHQLAGSKNVIELHGSIYNNYYIDCKQAFDLDYILKSNLVPRCNHCNGIIKPDVVLYEEQLNQEALNQAAFALTHCDTLIVGGTSLQVYPATSLIRYFMGKHLIIINKEPTAFDEQADLVIHDNIAKVLKKVVD